MALKLSTITEKEWQARKKDAGIPSSGVFAKAEQKNNIGPAISAFRKARTDFERKYTDGTWVALHKALIKLDEAITKLVGGEGVSGNRELSAPKAAALKKELEALRVEVNAKLKRLTAAVKSGKHKTDVEKDRKAHGDDILTMFNAN